MKNKKLSLNLNQINFIPSNKNISKDYYSIKELGFSTNEMILTVIIISIISAIFVPKFLKSLVFVELLIAEKHLLKSVKQCQAGLINGELIPKYNLPENNFSLGLNRKNNFTFLFTGIEGECKSNFSFNQLGVSRVNTNKDSFDYSLIINLITGEKTSKGKLPPWLDWWEGQYSPLIPLNDPLLD